MYKSIVSCLGVLLAVCLFVGGILSWVSLKPPPAPADPRELALRAMGPAQSEAGNQTWIGFREVGGSWFYHRDDAIKRLGTPVYDHTDKMGNHEVWWAGEGYALVIRYRYNDTPTYSRILDPHQVRSFPE